MHIYHVLINTLSAHMIHINLNAIFYTYVEDSPTKTIYIGHYVETRTHTHTHIHIHTHTCTHTCIHACMHTSNPRATQNSRLPVMVIQCKCKGHFQLSVISNSNLKVAFSSMSPVTQMRRSLPAQCHQ